MLFRSVSQSRYTRGLKYGEATEDYTVEEKTARTKEGRAEKEYKEYRDKKTDNQIKLSLVEKYFKTVEEAKELYANKYSETENPIYYILGMTATLGDEDT